MPRSSKAETEAKAARAAMIAEITERQRVEMLLSLMKPDDPRRSGLCALLTGKE